MASENKASYARIGFTVFVGTLAIVLTLIYIGGLRGRGNEVVVETCYNKPVNGLAVGSVVNFRGVKIGEVREIDFIGNKYDVEGPDNSRIYIKMALKGDLLGVKKSESDIAVKWIEKSVRRLGLRATVTSSGITGMSRIELNYFHDEREEDIPRISWQPRHGYIPPKMSLLDNFSDAATKVMNQINGMDFKAAWSNMNEAVAALSRATDSAKAMIESRQDEIERLMDDMVTTSAAVRDLAGQLRRNPSLLVRERIPEPLEETE